MGTCIGGEWEPASVGKGSLEGGEVEEAYIYFLRKISFYLPLFASRFASNYNKIKKITGTSLL